MDECVTIREDDAATDGENVAVAGGVNAAIAKVKIVAAIVGGEVVANIEDGLDDADAVGATVGSLDSSKTSDHTLVQAINDLQLKTAY
ncbi:hypothetical protein GUJ93_ZPchr0005g15719 [Zizania palustris]|uniref:Uncharacterized protein n=1 Tax=Zizania palustris TaxID=103762 RepID=A0A8J5VRG5_ZIZPA|nr:hypothetical protein GUJ93_ZPchr0005g15719 [Zizania palustris]